MSSLQNNDLSQLSPYVDISPNSQLVPYSPGQYQVTPHTLQSPQILRFSAEPGSNRYTRLTPPIFTDNKNQDDQSEPAYNSDRILVTPKINQVGLLIDIYA